MSVLGKKKQRRCGTLKASDGAVCGRGPGCSCWRFAKTRKVATRKPRLPQDARINRASPAHTTRATRSPMAKERVFAIRADSHPTAAAASSTVALDVSNSITASVRFNYCRIECVLCCLHVTRSWREKPCRWRRRLVHAEGAHASHCVSDARLGFIGAQHLRLRGELRLEFRVGDAGVSRGPIPIPHLQRGEKRHI